MDTEEAAAAGLSIRTQIWVGRILPLLREGAALPHYLEIYQDWDHHSPMYTIAIAIHTCQR